MIKQITLAELSRYQKNFYYKAHQHLEDNVFLSNLSSEPRVYKLCRLCGQMTSITANPEIKKEIKAILDKKTA
jgi:hypothetical protein